MKEVGEKKNWAWIEVIHKITVTKQKEEIKKTCCVDPAPDVEILSGYEEV